MEEKLYIVFVTLRMMNVPGMIDGRLKNLCVAKEEKVQVSGGSRSMGKLLKESRQGNKGTS